MIHTWDCIMRLMGRRSYRRDGNMLQRAPVRPRILQREIARRSLSMMPSTYQLMVEVDRNERNGVRLRVGLLGGDGRAAKGGGNRAKELS